MLNPTPEIVQASEDDVARYYGGIAFPTRWVAKALRKGDLVAGMGGVIETEPGVWVGFLEVPPFARSPSLFRHVKDVLEKAREAGAVKVKTWCDDGIPRAEAMMRRLGFQPTDETINGKVVWEWVL